MWHKVKGLDVIIHMYNRYETFEVTIFFNNWLYIRNIKSQMKTNSEDFKVKNEIKTASVGFITSRWLSPGVHPMHRKGADLYILQVINNYKYRLKIWDIYTCQFEWSGISYQGTYTNTIFTIALYMYVLHTTYKISAHISMYIYNYLPLPRGSYRSRRQPPRSGLPRERRWAEGKNIHCV